ncbi:hypothetical protein ACKUG4_20120 [Pseudomonas glycinae]|uniref:hypothetical protein n=1 Tax=Pseudomonas TaxID=286 RepID=UPI0007DCF67E|nr:hypothetical protein [Pseudomonas sp. DR 5-09]ANI57050.1 hypothetical protein PDR5_53200 [Pseudomonas sp. DR 5-09]
MLKKSFAAALITVALTSAAYADCPNATAITKQPDGSFIVTTPEGKFPVEVDPDNANQADVQNLLFTAVRLKEKDQATARAVCQYEDGKKPSLLGASLVWKSGKAITSSGSNWQGDDCATKNGNVKDCPFQ